MATNLFFIPHQDDEALTFGAGIRNHLDVGDECHIILYTDGATSAVYKQLNGEMKSSLHNRFYNPLEEGYSTMEVSDFIGYRNDEFYRSCRALGVPEQNIHIPRQLMRDGATTLEGCTHIILDFLNRFPDARVKTFTDLGGNHKDHANMGLAARMLLKCGVIRDLRMYIEPYHLKHVKKANRKNPIYKESSALHKHKVVHSLSEYTKWNPALKQFAIGYHSVKKCFDHAMANPVSYYHKPY